MRNIEKCFCHVGLNKIGPHEQHEASCQVGSVIYFVPTELKMQSIYM